MKRVKVSDVSELWDLALEGMGTGIFGPPFFKVSDNFTCKYLTT